MTVITASIPSTTPVERRGRRLSLISMRYRKSMAVDSTHAENTRIITNQINTCVPIPELTPMANRMENGNTTAILMTGSSFLKAMALLWLSDGRRRYTRIQSSRITSARTAPIPHHAHGVFLSVTLTAFTASKAAI